MNAEARESDRKAYRLLDTAWLAICDVQDELADSDTLQLELTKAGNALLEAKQAIRSRRDA